MSEEPLAPKKATFAWPFSLALNRLLDREPWARERLAPFAGESVELRNPPFPELRFTILPDGRLRAGGGPPSLVVTLTPAAVVALARGADHVLRAMQVEGNARLAAELTTLVRHLRWDFEEDLSKLFGDAAAHRLAGLARGLAAWQADAARRLGESVAAYATDEKRALVARAELEAFADDVARLRDAVARLEKRIERLG